MPSRIPDEYQKWNYITLSDFSTSSCGTFFSYGWLWFLAIVGIAVVGSDTYTAVNLLAFDKWGSTFKPIIPLDIAKWVFAGCIIFSWLLLAFEWIRAIRVIKRQNVAESYLDPLAVTVQSMRMGKNGQGWRRFLVFKELTKSRKGADYVALFCYFQFKGAIRVCLAEGPRQVINGLTLYSVMQANLIPVGKNASTDHPAFVQFWFNVKVLYEDSPRQAVVLFTMLFTLIIWLFSALCLLAAAVSYIGFLWHYLPKMALSKYCRRKVDKRLSRVVNEKTKAALDREDAKRKRDEEKASNGSQGFAPPSRAATLPLLVDESSPARPPLQHTNSISTTVGASSIFSREDSVDRFSRKPTLPDLNEDIEDVEKAGAGYGSMADAPFDRRQLRPGMPTRTETQQSNASVSSFASDRPLLQHANSFDRTAPPPIEHEPLPARMTSTSNMPRKPMPIRSMTGSSMQSQGSGQMPRSQSPMGTQQSTYAPMQPPLERSQTAQSLNAPGRKPSVGNGPAYEMQAQQMTRRPLPNSYQQQLNNQQQQPYQQPYQQQPPPQPQPPPTIESQTQQTYTAYSPNQPYAPFRPIQSSSQPSADRLQQPMRAYSLAAHDPAASQPMDRATPPPRMGTAPPMQGYRRPVPQSVPLNRTTGQQSGELPWASPNPTYGR